MTLLGRGFEATRPDLFVQRRAIGNLLHLFAGVRRPDALGILPDHHAEVVVRPWQQRQKLARPGPHAVQSELPRGLGRPERIPDVGAPAG
jgi:hypothetical protein